MVKKVVHHLSMHTASLDERYASNSFKHISAARSSQHLAVFSKLLERHLLDVRGSNISNVVPEQMGRLLILLDRSHWNKWQICSFRDKTLLI